MGLDRHDLHGSVISFELSFSDLFVLFCFISCVLQISRQLCTCLKTKVRPIGSLYFPDVTLKDNLGRGKSLQTKKEIQRLFQPVCGQERGHCSDFSQGE